MSRLDPAWLREQQRIMDTRHHYGIARQYHPKASCGNSWCPNSGDGSRHFKRECYRCQFAYWGAGK